MARSTAKGRAALALALAAAAVIAIVLVFPWAIERATRVYLLENPEVIAEAIQALRQGERERAVERQQLALAEHAEALRHDPASAVGGNPDGDVTVVEFFDYKCQFCKQYRPVRDALLAADRGVRFVYKEFPILGGESVLAARAALAVRAQDPGLYIPYHDALLQTVGALDEDTLLQIAAEFGLDVQALAIAILQENYALAAALGMAGPEVDTILQENYALAAALGIDGTPGIVIGDAVVPGFIELADTQLLVARARTDCRTCR